MAILLEQRSQQSFYLASQHLFGRNQVRADTLLDNPNASQSHATVSWNGTAWEMTDHSRAGTLINNVAIAPNTPIALAIGQVLRFAAGATQSFKVLDLAAPRPMLLPLGHTQAAIALDSQHFLPNESAPQAVVRRNENGQWSWQDVHGSMALQDGDTLHVAGQDWLFFNKQSDSAAATLPLPLPAQPGVIDEQFAAQFNFKVSQNEEHVQLALLAKDTHIDLGERSHHYGLLTLARKRLLDAQQGFDALSQGWISTDRFAAMLGVEEKHANMLLHRARLQFTRQGPAAASFCECIERRRGELRFGHFGFQIMRGCELEAVFEPL
jgi:FHA domain